MGRIKKKFRACLGNFECLLKMQRKKKREKKKKVRTNAEWKSKVLDSSTTSSFRPWNLTFQWEGNEAQSPKAGLSRQAHSPSLDSGV